MHEESAGSFVSGQRVAIVCGHFSPEVGYQEVDLARSFTRLGAQVRVVTSTHVSPNARALVDGEYQAGTANLEGYEIVRLTPRFTVGPNVFGCNAKPAVAEFAPNHVILIGPGKLFGLDLFSSEPSPWRRITVMQDNSEARAATAGRLPRSMRAVAHGLVKRRAYRRVVRNADRIILNVPETRTIVEPWLKPHERELLVLKGVELRLGFDPDRFYLDAAGRQAWRGRHGIADDEFVLSTCTRATPSKKLEDVISTVSSLRAEGLAVRYVLAGVLDDDYGERLRRYASAQPDPTAFLLLPALRHDEMRDLFCAGDLGLWSQAAITIQQAMGTGLPVVLRRKPTVSHLLKPGRNGWYVELGDSLDDVLSLAVKSLSEVTAASRLSHREGIAELNRTYLSYDVIAREIVSGLS